MIAPNCFAFTNSSSGVSLEVNIISSPLIPTFSASINSGNELQSVPIPSSLRIFRMYGLGQALTAKKFLNPSLFLPLTQEKAL